MIYALDYSAHNQTRIKDMWFLLSVFDDDTLVSSN